jgi:RNA recognition motif-containing protein
MRVYISNLPYTTTGRELRDAFQLYGCTDATVMRDRETQRSRGFGFATLDRGEDAIADGVELGGRILRIAPATERTPRAT